MMNWNIVLYIVHSFWFVLQIYERQIWADCLLLGYLVCKTFLHSGKCKLEVGCGCGYASGTGRAVTQLLEIL